MTFRWVVSFFVVAGVLADQIAAQQVSVRRVAAEHRVDIEIDGEHFTSYHFGPEFDEKPIFYPIYSPGGNMVNRAYPMRKDVEDEATDHPHQQSLFFAYGSVNGVDFWNPQAGRRIAHKGIVELASGSPGRLDVLHEWVDPDGVTLLLERRRATFGAGEGYRWTDHDITLTALERKVVFGDSKEGMFAIRVARPLEERLGSARYVNAYGWETEKGIWGKRSPWVALKGEVNGERLTVAIFEHPVTENHPSYWHARAYGLFSVNPLGRSDFVSGVEPLNKTLAPHESFRFRYRVVIFSGHPEKERLDEHYWEYVK